MKLKDLFRFGLTNLLRRKTRSLLTGLSMAVGVMCIVVLISVGLGYEQSYRESIESMGSLTKIDVTASTGSYGRKAILNGKAVEAFKGIDGVEAVTPVLQKSAYIVSGNYVNMVRIYGLDTDVLGSFISSASKGVFPEEGTRSHPEVIFTDDVPAGFANRANNWQPAVDQYGNPLVDLMNQPVRLTFDYSGISGGQQEGTDGRAVASSGLISLKVTGICPAVSGNFSSAAFMSYDRLTEMLGIRDNDPVYELVWVKASNVNDVQRIAKIIQDAGLSTYSLNDMLETVRHQSRQIQGMLGALGAVAILISAICVANTMMMAITERTREIGVLKVIGAERSDIARMFLVEALLVGFIGGIAGLILSFVMKFLIPVIFASRDLRCVIPLWLAVCGVLFAGIVAVLAALVPAGKATRISPNEAIRTE
ncbi:MAG: ABC transporter permease [Eubacteriales bacterium]|nr:ABC transporter permease [Eubacteriales bacterium]